MTTEYTGMCIGGPRDGQTVVSDGKSFTSVKAQDAGTTVLLVEAIKDPEAAIPLELVVYEWRPISITYAGVFALWLPEGTSTEDGLLQLWSSYRAAKAT